MRALWLLILSVVFGQRVGPFGRNPGSLGGRKKTILVKGKEFVIFQERMDWSNAAKKCRQEGLELAKVTTLFQAVRIYASAGTYTWVGLRSKTGKDGVWRWMDGEKSSRDNTPWGAIQPNDEGDLLCGYIAIRKGSLADTDCNKRYMVACSAPAEEETAENPQPEIPAEPVRKPGFSLLRSQNVGPLPDSLSAEPEADSEPATTTEGATDVALDSSSNSAPKANHVDLTGKTGQMQRIKDPKFQAKKKDIGRTVYVNYDTDEDGLTDFEDTIDPEIEYVEADGVLMFHLDFEQNPEHHCTGLDDFGNQLWPSDLAGRPMFLTSCQDTQTFQPDIYPDTPEIEYLPMCNGNWGDCSADPLVDPCCDVHRGINWTQAVCKCREYGGDVATPYDVSQDTYMFDFIESIFNERFNFSNPKFCEGGEANKNTLECPFGSEGLTKSNWGQMIVWIGYNYDDTAEKWQMVNGTDLDMLYHYFGLVGSGGNEGRRKRALDEVNVNEDGDVTITIDNSHIVGGEDIDVLYNDEKSPACIGVVYDVDPGDQEEKLQWRELDCLRAQNVMCEVDFRNTGVCRFGNIPTDDENWDEYTKITTDPFGVDPDRCIFWEKCFEGEIVSGQCDFDERFDTVLRKCMPATAVGPCNVNECVNQTHVCTGENMHCEDTIGTYACICNTGYRWQDGKDTATAENPDGRSPTPENNFWVYDIGSDPEDPLTQVDGNGNHVEGVDSCIDLDECIAGVACPNNATCSNLDIVTTGRFYECVCDDGYLPVYNLSSNATDDLGSPYYAELLECVDEDECEAGTVTCSGPTQCVNVIGSFFCGCNVGYTTDAECTTCIDDNMHLGDDSPADLCVAESDGTCCENIDECDGISINLCPVDADCVDNDGSYFCDCHNPEEYILEETQPGSGKWVCVDKDECADPAWNSCDVNSACINLDPSYECDCNEGWDNCADIFNGEIMGTCCEDRNECDKDAPCHQFGDCTNLVGLWDIWGNDGMEYVIGYYCNCSAGYTGDGYSSCLDIAECESETDGCDENSQCVNTAGNYLCLCNNGWAVEEDKNEFYTGLLPSESCVDLDECQMNKTYNACDDNAACNNTVGSYECYCNDGYEGNGLKCLDVQECLDPLTNDCDEGIIRPLIHEGTATCVNSPGGYDCTCETGFTGDGFNVVAGGDGCEDVDECDGTSPCHADGVCSNTVGSYLCTCQEGYQMVVDSEPDCEDVDECGIEGSCHEDSTCDNTVGSYTCTCIEGYDGDGQFCADINECQTTARMGGNNNCSALATCANTDASYTCTCPDGYTASGTPSGEICDEIDECADSADNDCDDDATCTNTPAGSFTCTCNEGYVGTGVDGDCNDQNECLNALHDCDVLATCTDNIGSFTCECDEGYGSVNDPPARTGDCNNLNECADDALNNCDTNAQCINLMPPDFFTCTCDSGYTGDGLTCTVVNECDDGTHNCDTEATCVNEDGGFTCSCNTGYTDHLAADGLSILAGASGLACEDINECEILGSCSNNTDCVNSVGSYSCGCDEGYTGPSPDECTDINECDDPNTCDPNADCANTDGSFTCTCRTGYTGNGFICDDDDECRDLPEPGCDEFANCVNDPGTYHCECFTGYTSPLGTALAGDCVPRDECAENPAICPLPESGGVCIDMPPNQNGYMCDCEAGFTYIEELNFCQDFNECSVFPCPDGAQCMNLEPSYSCSCMPGYTQNGTLAPAGDGVCTEFDECALGVSNCNLTTSICVNTFGSHLCICKAGYVPDGNGNCVDLDECMASLCPMEASSCVNYEGGYDCFCPDGFIGSMTLSLVAMDTVNNEVITSEQMSFECGDRDECIQLVGQGCPVNAQCQNIPGSVSCLCAPGFEDANAGSSQLAPNCVDVDECQNSTCLAISTCANTVGSFDCNCPTGFDGDGITACTNVDECALAATGGRKRRQTIDSGNSTTNGTTTAPANCDATAICIDTEGSFTCVCPAGTAVNANNQCNDIDECAGTAHGCAVDEICLNFLGGHTCFFVPNTTPKPSVVGDPHVRVGAPDEPAICFDITDEDKSVLSLITDLDSGLEVNGQVFTESVRKEKSRLERIGVVSPRGLEIGIYVDQVTVGTSGNIHQRYTYEEHVSKGLDDVHFIIHPVEKGTPKRGITISIGSNSEIRFNIFIKSQKDSMIFEIERSSGFGNNLTGVLGQTMRGGTPYHVTDDGIIHVRDRTIESWDHEWSAIHSCKQIGKSATEIFLGHPISSYRVTNLFGQLKPTWLDAILEAIGLPKRRR